MQGSGIVFHFEHEALKEQLITQINKNNKEIGRLETELPDRKTKLIDMEKHGLVRSQDYSNAEQELMMLETTLLNLRTKNDLLNFYAAHLPPGSSELTLQDVHQLGFVEQVYGLAMMKQVGHPR